MKSIVFGQVQEQMRQLNQQIQMLVEESAARRKRRQVSGPGPGVRKKQLISPGNYYILVNCICLLINF